MVSLVERSKGALLLLGGRLITVKAVAIVGDGDTSYDNAKDLLDDFLPEDCQVFIPSYIKGPGLKNVHKWLNDYDVPYERVSKDSLIDRLDQATGLVYLIIVGTEGLDQEIELAQHLGIPVYDLSQALWAVPNRSNDPGVPLDGSQSHADAPEGSSEGNDIPPKDLVLETVSEPRSIETFNKFMLNEMPITREEVEEIVRSAILHHESGWHSQEYVAPPPVEDAVPEDADRPEGSIKYYKKKSGKIRKAGRSKALAGETEIWLTEEEASALSA